MKIQVKFEGINQFSRPVFKDINSDARYGSINKLFHNNVAEEDLKNSIAEKDLCYFGDSFDCEPWGSSAEIDIVWRALV